MMKVYIRLNIESEYVLEDLLALFNPNNNGTLISPFGVCPEFWRDSSVKTLEEFMLINGHSGDYDVWLHGFGKRCELDTSQENCVYLVMPVDDDDD